MNTPVFQRRHAERFAQLLDEADGGRRHHLRSEFDADLGPLVTLTQQLTAAGAELDLCPGVEVDAEFRTGLRAMLVATAVRDGIGVTAKLPEPDERESTFAERLVRPLTKAGRGGAGRTRPTRTVSPAARRARTRAAVIVGVAAGTLALSGMSAASGDAMPGDALYGVKRSTERAQLALASSEVSRGQLYLTFARTRVAEAGSVPPESAGLVRVLDDMDDEASEGVRLLTTAWYARRDPTTLESVDEFVKHQGSDLDMLLEKTTGPNYLRVKDSINLLEKIINRVKALREASSCGAAATRVDDLGPQPDACQQASGSGANRPQGSTGKPATGPSPAANEASSEDGGNGRHKKPLPDPAGDSLTGAPGHGR